MSNFTNEAKKKLEEMGKEFECQNEYRVQIGKRFSCIDYVWLKKIPHPNGEKKVVVVAFEITKDLSKVWDMKKMKGDIVNLQLSNAPLGVLVIPCREELNKQAEALDANTWLAKIDDYLEALKDIGKPTKVEVWCFDQTKGELFLFT